MPLDDLEVAREFPVGDVLAELALFPLAGRGEVLDEGVAETFARRLSTASAAAPLPTACAAAPALRELAVVRVAFHHRLGLDPVLDAVQARAERGGEDHVGIRVGRGDAVLDALRLRAARNDAQRARAVLDATVASVGAQKPGISRV